MSGWMPFWLEQSAVVRRLAQWKLRREAACAALPEAAALAYAVTPDGVTILAPCAGEGQPLPNALLAGPGLYRAAGFVWDCNRPGLYRICQPYQENRQFVIPDPTDVLATALALSRLFVRGNGDDFLTSEALAKVARTRLVVCTCGPAAQFVCATLSGLGHGCRVVAAQTDQQPNGYNDGHVMLEVAQAGGWVAVDVSAACWFAGLDGAALDFFSLCRTLAQGGMPELRSWPGPGPGQGPVDWTGFVHPGGYRYDFLEWLAAACEDGRESMYRRTCAVPYFREGRAVTATVLGAGGAFVAPQGWLMLDPEAFYQRFYAPGANE